MQRRQVDGSDHAFHTVPGYKTKADGSIVALNELWKLEYVVLA